MQHYIHILWNNGYNNKIYTDSVRESYDVVRNKMNYRDMALIYLVGPDYIRCVHNDNWTPYSNELAKEMPR
jgi:hypothetical protein